MAYQGNSPAANFQSLPAVQRFNGTGSATAFTLASVVANDQSILVSVDGVTQDSNAYAVNGTTLTFTAAPSSGTGNIFVNTISPVGSTVVPPDGSVTQAKVAGQAINESKLQVSNNPTNGLFLSAQSGNTGGLTWAAASAGKVLQVVSTTKTDTQSVQSINFTDVFSVAITPSATSSKIFILLNINITGNTRYGGLKMYRDSTQINLGDASGSRTRVSISSEANHDASNDQYVQKNGSSSFLDSPSTTNAVTYKVKVGSTQNADSNNYTYINRPANYDNGNYINNGASTFTLMEIAG